MIKDEELSKKFEGADKMTNQQAIQWAMDKYGWAKRTSESYYYAWKKIYMHGANCIPKDVKKSMNMDTSKVAAALGDMADKWHKVELKDGRGRSKSEPVVKEAEIKIISPTLHEINEEFIKSLKGDFKPEIDAMEQKESAEAIIETVKELQVIQPKEEHKPLEAEKEPINKEYFEEQKPAFKGTEIKFEGDNGHYSIQDKLFILKNDDGELMFESIIQWNKFKSEIDEAFKYAEKLGGLI